MSKSRGNVVNPDDYVDRVGADNLRMYLLFCGAWEEVGDFSDRALMGIVRFTRRLGSLLLRDIPAGTGVVDLAPLDRTIARVEGDIERFKFNTAIAAVMEATSWAIDTWPVMSAAERSRTASTLVLLLAPFAPHLAEELWARLGETYSVHQQPWPAYRPEALANDEITLVVQVNGRVRGRITAARGLPEAEAVRLALGDRGVSRHFDGRAPVHVVYIPDRLINLVTRRNAHDPDDVSARRH